VQRQTQLSRIIVDDADRLESQMGIGQYVLQDHRAGVTGSQQQDAGSIAYVCSSTQSEQPALESNGPKAHQT
jgi:hypothetical protein